MSYLLIVYQLLECAHSQEAIIKLHLRYTIDYSNMIYFEWSDYLLNLLISYLTY